MKVTICDICKKQFEEFETRYSIKRKRQFFEIEGFPYLGEEKIDICQKCMEAVRILSTKESN